MVNNWLIFNQLRTSSRPTRRGILGATIVLLANATVPVGLRSLQLSFTKIRVVVASAGWVRHLEKAGFVVRVAETAGLDAVKRRLGVPADLKSCHTAEVDGYVPEGHVPAAAVRRLLEQRPNGIGLAVPGMPAGSPGMEGGVLQKYEVVLFGATGRQTFMHFVGRTLRGRQPRDKV